MKKDRQSWLIRGEDGPKFDGYVCLGVGDQFSDLVDQLKIRSIDLFIGINGEIEGGYYGSEDYSYYYVTEDKFNELFPIEQNIMDEQVAETTITLPLSFLKKTIDALQVGFENTEEVFILNVQRTTRSDRANAARLENEMVGISNIISELKTFL